MLVLETSLKKNSQLGECNFIRWKEYITDIIKFEIVSVNQWYSVDAILLLS